MNWPIFQEIGFSTLAGRVGWDICQMIVEVFLISFSLIDNS